jgi:prohibitin 1
MNRKHFSLKTVAFFAFMAFLTSSCTVVKQGEVGVKRKLGEYKEQPYTEGLRVFNPFFTSIIRIPTRTVNLEVSLNLPSREGLTIQSDVSILYNVSARKAPDILRTVGPDYERSIILPVFRSAVADVTARFDAKDMHTGERATIEVAIRDQMSKLLSGRGINVEAVLLKSIVLPRSLSVAIEQKLEAEQAAQRMEFVLQEARREAERKRIEAEGVRDAQNIIAQGLSPILVQYKSIEAFLELAKSNNAKVIISDGKTPFILNSDDNVPAAPTRNTRNN